MRIKFTVLGNPCSQKRHRTVKRGNKYIQYASDAVMTGGKRL